MDGCVATGRTKEIAGKNMREAIEFHVDGLREEGHEVPEPRSDSPFVEIVSKLLPGERQKLFPTSFTPFIP
ncbi:MAG: type II toxin-antitoxin system HicB family antitoxin [bacterium]